MIRRHREGNPNCYFCDDNETSSLFFSYPTAEVVWACIANKCLGADNIPRNLSQCWEWWCEAWLPQGRKCPVWGVAAICWAIWKARNKACFDKKLINSKLQIEQTLVIPKVAAIQCVIILLYIYWREH